MINTTVLALAPEDVEGVVNINFNSEFVSATRSFAVVIVMLWILYILKDYVFPSRGGGMGMMGGQGGGFQKLLTVVALFIMLDPNSLNKLAETVLKAFIYIGGMVPYVRDIFNIEGNGNGVVTPSGGGGYS